MARALLSLPALALALALALAPGRPPAGEVRSAARLAAGTILAERDLVAAEGGEALAGALVGRQLVRAVPGGSPLGEADVKAPDLVSRNQIVTILFRRGALEIRAEGRALAAGAAGAPVRVLNTASRQAVEALVTGDGVVEVAR